VRPRAILDTVVKRSQLETNDLRVPQVEKNKMSKKEG
jgi:hypothetical protein